MAWERRNMSTYKYKNKKIQAINKPEAAFKLGLTYYKDIALLRKIEPKIVIPTHYADKGVTYEVPQAELAAFLAEMAAQDAETLDVFKLKESELGDKARVIVLNRQSK